MLDNASGGAKFNRADVKRVYFGNWLRDYSQAMDIAGLKKLSSDTLVLILSVLGFMTFGYATEEFEVTADRVGVYLPVEHIDNPKGYGGAEDPRQYHQKLRPPVDPRELEVDERTGMKKYMATENEGFDTSTAHIRRTFRGCIEHGRRSGGQEGADLWEAYRLMGTGLHTLEDLLAHSNWCEIALRKMGYEEVFCHVGDNTHINTPNGSAPPLVTGTFGGADFMHSMLGEATDHMSQASVTALSDKMNESKNSDASSKISQLKSIISKLNIGGGDEKLNQGQQLQEQSQAYNFDPNNVAPPEVQKQLLDLLKWRDSVFRDVSKKIEMIPGLSDLVEELTNALNAYVYTVIAPWLTPILEQATGVLGEGSKAVIDSDDQYEVFNNPNASDPSHSMLSKDHFNLILNEPAGKIAKVVVTYSVQLIVQAWSDDSDPDQVIDRILEAFHHPYYTDGRSQIQHQMFQEMEKWFGGLGSDVGQETIQALTKESVREGKNKRFAEEGQGMIEPGYGGHSHGVGSGGYGGGAGRYSSGGGGGGGYQQSSYSSGRQEYGGGDQGSGSNRYGSSDDYGSGRRTEDDSYDTRRNDDSYGSSYGRQEQSYGSRRDDDESSYNRNNDSYGSGRRHEESSYGRGDDSYGSGRRNDESSYGVSEDSYGSGRRHDESSYGRSDDSYGRGQDSYGSGRTEPSYDSSYGGGREESSRYGRNNEGSSYGRNDDSYGSGNRYGGGDSYGSSYDRQESQRDEDSYGGSERHHHGGGYAPSYEGREGGNSYSSGGGFGSAGYGGEDNNRPGYNPSYGGDETFGAERLNISDDGENEGYGSGGYGRRRNEYDSGY
ncbi:Het-C-domain-containing protein [Marasmius fiardii PR-910]|nr:Het-C-domain-containing protein [Marasmius fiardii PR-910]